MTNANHLLSLARRFLALDSMHFRMVIALGLSSIAPGLAIASAASVPPVTGSAASDSVKSCQEIFHSGHEFRLGNALDSETILTLRKSGEGANESGAIKRGDKVVIGGSQGGMLCIETMYSGAMGWVPQKSVDLLSHDVTPSKDAWAGIWKDRDGSWFVVSPNFDNSVTVVDGWTYDPSNKSFGSLRGLNGSTEGGLSGMAKSLLFKKEMVLNAQLTPRQQQIVRDGICRFSAYLLTNVLVISNQRGFCGGAGTSFDGIYRRVETYPPSSVKDHPATTAAAR